jgi:hypothetical protein
MRQKREREDKMLHRGVHNCGDICKRSNFSLLSSKGKRFRLMLMIALLLFISILVFSIVLHVYSQSLARKALSLLSESATIKVGSTENSIMPFVSRYGGSKWHPSTSFADDTYDDKVNRQISGSTNVYSYEMKISPFHAFTAKGEQTGRLHTALIYLMGHSPNYLRDPLGLRNWLVVVHVRIQDGRVAAVSGTSLVEGSNGWLGDDWTHSSELDEANGVSPAYSVETTILEIPPDSGQGLIEWLTPRATSDQVQASYNLNDRCFNGIHPCTSLCELKPNLFKYLKMHQEIKGASVAAYCQEPRP